MRDEFVSPPQAIAVARVTTGTMRRTNDYDILRHQSKQIRKVDLNV